jgi:histidinol-phosphate aminotransferase
MSELVRPNIAQMAGYIPGEQPTDPRVIKLNTNENPYPPSPKVMEAIRAVTAEQLRRYPSPNAKAFREAAAHVHGVSPDMILATNGGDELLSVAIRACAGPAETVAFLEPSYSLYPVLADLQGARKLVLSYRIEGTTWRLPEGIEKTQAAILLIVNPNAPSGTLSDVAELGNIARHFRGVLVIDEAYVDFAPGSALELVRQYPNVLILRSMSKGYGLAGLRFGYGIGQATLLQQLEKVRDSYPCDAVAIAAATAAILDQTYARQSWSKVIAERTRLAAALGAMGFALAESHSNFVLATVPAGKVTAKQVYETLKGRNILVRWWDLPRIADKIRITVGTAEQNDALLKELSGIVR